MTSISQCGEQRLLYCDRWSMREFQAGFVQDLCLGWALHGVTGALAVSNPAPLDVQPVGMVVVAFCSHASPRFLHPGSLFLPQWWTRSLVLAALGDPGIRWGVEELDSE